MTVLPSGQVVRPGDTLVLFADLSGFTDAEFDQVTRALRAKLPGVEVCIINALGGYVYRPDGTEAA